MTRTNHNLMSVSKSKAVNADIPFLVTGVPFAAQALAEIVWVEIK